jgi:hypothetical protein
VEKQQKKNNKKKKKQQQTKKRKEEEEEEISPHYMTFRLFIALRKNSIDFLDFVESSVGAAFSPPRII